MQNDIIYNVKVPYKNKAFVKEEKVLGYLLNIAHPDGGSKAVFFRSKGFNETNVNIFKKQILSVIHNQEIENTGNSPHGKKYIVKGDISTPNGDIITIRTIWIVINNTRKPSFVTAYCV